MRGAMVRPEQRERFWSSVGQTLALLAVLLMTAVPQGTMLARSGGQVFITICSGHGPLTIAAPDGSGGKKAPADGKRSNAPCPFASHAPSVPVPLLARVSVSLPSPSPDAGASLASRPAPGRGLAAPPPPSRGPPSLSI